MQTINPSSLLGAAIGAAPRGPLTRWLWRPMLVVALATLTACGGTSGHLLEVAIEGLQADGLVLSLTPDAPQRELPRTAMSYTFQSLVPGQAYDVAVRKHPLNQLCKVVNGRGQSTLALINDVKVICQTTLLNDTGSLLAEDGAEGRDAVSVLAGTALTKIGTGAKGFDFSRLCVKDSAGTVEVCQGEKTAADVGAAVGGWVCTRDNVTGLVWRIHDPVGDSALCGMTEWFVPTSHELTSLLDLGGSPSSLVVPQDYFPQMGSGKYMVNANGEEPFYLDAGYGGIHAAKPSDSLILQRVAFTGKPLVNEDVQDGTAIFVAKNLGLMWYLPQQQAAASFQATRSMAAGLAVGGHADWRLPNYKELVSLLDQYYACVANDCPLLSGYMDDVAGTAYPGFWSSTVDPLDGTSSLEQRQRFSASPVPGGFETRVVSPGLPLRAVYVRQTSAVQSP